MTLKHAWTTDAPTIRAHNDLDRLLDNVAMTVDERVKIQLAFNTVLETAFDRGRQFERTAVTKAQLEIQAELLTCSNNPTVKA